MINNKKIGFTLAETLIAIAVIGIISALTMPVIIKNYQKRHFLVKLKDTYSILQNAKMRAEMDYGPMKDWDKSPWFDIYVKPYLKLTEYKETHASHFVSGVERVSYRDPFRYNGFKRYILSNGVELSVKSCTIGGDYNYCTIHVDLNGPKSPNTYGKDLHGFSYFFNTTTWNTVQYKGKLLPGHHLYVSKDICLANSDTYETGILACTYYIFKNNWQYPDWFPY